jgi:putative oligomerization/nucleic acid binding protein
MPPTTAALPQPTRSALAAIAGRHGFTPEAVAAMWHALAQGTGGMAQFDHPEFGGAGQWMRGGMMMVADFGNPDLRRRVDALCDHLARAMAEQPALAPSVDSAEAASAASTEPHGIVPGAAGVRNWWPRSLGTPSSTGAQSGMRYAYFPEQRQLAVDRHGSVTVYDTGDHQIGGVSQQQGVRGTLIFASQHGPVELERLRVVSPAAAEPVRPVIDLPPRAGGAPGAARLSPTPLQRPEAAAPTPTIPAQPPALAMHSAPVHTAAPSPMARPQTADEVLSTIDRLAEMHERGVLTAEEFGAKKAELLTRI